MKKLSLSLLLWALLLPAGAVAQAPVDILLRRVGSQWTVSLLPGSSIDGLVSNLQFSLAIPSDDPAWSWSLPAGQIGYLPLEAAAPPDTLPGSLRQTFAAFGLASLQSQGANWPAGTEVPVLTLQYTGTGVLSLSQSDWAISRNGTYYIEVNGLPRTGQVRNQGFALSSSLLPPDQGLPSLFPNPTQGVVSLQWESDRTRLVHLRCLDLMGRELWQAQRLAQPGPQVWTLDLSGLAQGLYFLEIQPAGLAPYALSVQVSP